jgi:hypothetical protein
MLLGKAAILKTPAKRVGVIIRRHIFISMAVLGSPSFFQPLTPTPLALSLTLVNA